MRKVKPPSASAGDIPAWFMTYSDVVTLMMTFFILLLTFATSEPEGFDQMKISMFGARGAQGLVGDPQDGTENDSWNVRVRDRASRLTDRGAEVPPVNKASSSEAVDKGLAGLEEDQNREIVDTFSIVVPGNSLATADGELYQYGEHNMITLAKMMRARTYELTIEISSQTQLNRALACIQFLHHVQKISAVRLSVCHDRFHDLEPDQVRLTLRHFQISSHGEKRTEAPQQAQ